MERLETSVENLYYYESEVGEFLEVQPCDIVSGEWLDHQKSAKKQNGKVNRMAKIEITSDFQEKYGLELDNVLVYEEEEIDDNDAYDNSEALYYLITPD